MAAKMKFDYVPRTLDEAHEYLDTHLKDKEQFKNESEDDVIANSHHTLGRFIRNEWFLWWSVDLMETILAKDPYAKYPILKPELVRYFHDLGVEYADDMSGIIVISFHKKLNGKPYDMDEDIKAIKQFYIDNENNLKESKRNEQE